MSIRSSVNVFLIFIVVGIEVEGEEGWDGMGGWELTWAVPAHSSDT
jgi:hypothetical protein